jgi:hypothetical protein
MNKNTTGKSAASRTRSAKRAWGEQMPSLERENREAILFETAARLFNQHGFTERA